MRKYNLSFIFPILLLLFFSSCDDHDRLDSNIYTGYVLTDNHDAMSYDDYLSQDASRAVGVVFATATVDHPMMAVMLDEVDNIKFADSLGIDQGTSGDLAAYDGFTNTVALQNSYNEKTGKGSPLGDIAFRRHLFGQSDYVPSVAEMRLLIASLSIVNPIIEKLGGTPISKESSGGSCWYWTSTEVSVNKARQAWLVSAVNGAIQETPKDEGHSSRMIVSLNY